MPFYIIYDHVTCVYYIIYGHVTGVGGFVRHTKEWVLNRKLHVIFLLNVLQRKKLLHEDGEKKGDGKINEDKIKMLRKKNSELVILSKELEDKVKTLKTENEQLVCIICSTIWSEGNNIHMEGRQ